jgi:hypothetical protein
MAYRNDPDRFHPAIPGRVQALEKRPSRRNGSAVSLL